MSIKELDTTAAELKATLAEIEELTERAEALKDAIKLAMVNAEAESVTGTGWKASWKNVTSSRFDSKAFKAAHADLYSEYSKTTVQTRFIFA